MTHFRSAVIASFMLLAPVTLAGLAGCTVLQSTITATHDHSQSIADAKSLAVETRNGAITLTRDDQATELSVTATVRCAGATQAEADQRAAASTLVVERTDAGEVRVSVTYAPRASTGGTYSNDGATIVVRAPGTLNGVTLRSGNGAITSDGFAGTINARTSNGRITVTGHAGAVDLHTSNGRVEATGIAGPVEIETSNGAITAELSDGSTQNVNARTSNGAIQLVLPAAWNGAMTATTSNGAVSVDAATGRATNVKVARGEGAATIGTGTATATLRTSNGAVKVTVK